MKVFDLFVEKKQNGFHYEKVLENIVQNLVHLQILMFIK